MEGNAVCQVNVQMQQNLFVAKHGLVIEINDHDNYKNN